MNPKWIANVTAVHLRPLASTHRAVSSRLTRYLLGMKVITEHIRVHVVQPLLEPSVNTFTHWFHSFYTRPDLHRSPISRPCIHTRLGAVGLLLTYDYNPVGTKSLRNRYGWRLSQGWHGRWSLPKHLSPDSASARGRIQLQRFPWAQQWPAINTLRVFSKFNHT